MPTAYLVVPALVALAAILFIRIVPRHVHIVDGDTIAVRDRKWRLAGYDAPEFDQPGGRQASAHLRDILAEGRTIGIVTGSDAYGRLLVRIFTKRGPLASRMILAGWGHPEGMLGWFLCLRARIGKRGVWAKKGVVHTPRLWREMHPRAERGAYRPSQGGKRRGPNLRFDYNPRKGLKLPGGFHLP